jgi:hypothetical protein
MRHYRADANGFSRSVGPALDALFAALTGKNYKLAVDMCNNAIQKMTQHRLKEPQSFHKDYFWIICSLLLAIRVFCECIVSIQSQGSSSSKSLTSSRLLYCIPLLMRIGNPSDALMLILCHSLFVLTPEERKTLSMTVNGAWNLLRASRSMKDQSILLTSNNFGQFFQIMGADSNCFEKTADVADPKDKKAAKGQKDAQKNKDPQRTALLKMFSPGLNRKIAEGLLDNLESCAAMSNALAKDSTPVIIDCATMSIGKVCLIEAATMHLVSDEDLREAKRLITADFSEFNFFVKKAVDVKFNVSKQTASPSVLDRIKESLDSCKGDEDDAAESDESGSFISKVVDAFNPLKKIAPAITTVVQICSKDLPAILRKLTNEYFSDREKKFDLLRNEDDCQENGIPFNPAQLSEPGNYMSITKKISDPLRIKYIKIVADKADKELQPLVHDILHSAAVQVVLTAPPLSTLSTDTYEKLIMAAIKAAFAAAVIFRVRSIMEMEMFYSRLLMYAKLVPAKERMLVVARDYFSGISALLRPSILVHAAAFAACAKAIFLTVNISALPGTFFRRMVQFQSFCTNEHVTRCCFRC